MKIKTLTEWHEGCLDQGDIITDESIKCVLNALHPYKAKLNLVQMFSYCQGAIPYVCSYQSQSVLVVRRTPTPQKIVTKR